MLLRLRLLLLIAMMGYTGPDARSEEDRKMGGEGFGKIVNIFVAISAIVLLVLIVLAVMSMAGQFDSDLLDPIT